MSTKIYSLTERANQEKAQSYRNLIVDFVRTATAFGVVSIHVHSDTQAANALGLFFIVLCVPFFFITSLTYFIVTLKERNSINVITAKIWKRIGVPFLSWSVIYVVLFLIKDMITGKSRPINIGQIFLYGGSTEHLYYLPALVNMQFLALGIFLLISTTRRVLGLCISIAAICYFSWGYFHNYYGVTPPISILIFMVMAFYLASGTRSLKTYWPDLVVGIILLLVSTSSIWLTYPVSYRNGLINLPIGGIGLFMIASNIQSIVTSAWLTTLTSTTYGVYLSHILFLEGLEFFLEKGPFSIRYDFITKLLITLFVFIISVLFTLMVRKFSLARFLLLGENR